MKRLQKVISESGYTSRRKAETLITEGKVLVNNKVVRELGTKVGIDDIITVEGNVLNKDVKKEYYLLNKPRNIISSVSDEKGRKTVVDLIDTDARIYPIGRLDYDTTVILLLTNDGDFANHLMHPSNNIKKTYLAKVEGIINKDQINELKKGIIIDNKKINIVNFKVKRKDINKNYTFIEITINEGKNHIVKNIFQKIGLPVNKLTRTNYEFLDLKGLNSGDYRELSIKEVKKFYSL